MSFDGMQDIFERVLKEVLEEHLIMNKLEKGEELTNEEYEKLFQSFYSEASDNISELKQLTSLKTQLVLRGVRGLTKPIKFLRGVSDAISVVRCGSKEYKDNYCRVLQGITITSNNLIQDNVNTLVLQRGEAKKYGDSYKEFLSEFEERKDDYRQDYQSPYAAESVMAMQQARAKIVELSGQYVKKRYL